MFLATGKRSQPEMLIAAARNNLSIQFYYLWASLTGEPFFVFIIEGLYRQENKPEEKKLLDYLLELPLEKHKPYNGTRQPQKAIFLFTTGTGGSNVEKKLH